MAKAEEFPDRDTLLKAHPGADWAEYGPILHYKGDRRFVSTYLGQHEWVIINVEDTDERYRDPGYEGDEEHGWGYVKFEGWIEPGPNDNHPGHPTRQGKPITKDDLLFADRQKLADYLGESDPLTPRGEENDDEMRDEYDFSGGVRGKYVSRYKAGVTVNGHPQVIEVKK